MTVKEFTTAVDRVVDQGKGTEFVVDGRKMVAYKPSEGQYAMLLASIGRGASEMERISGVINFFIKIMDEDSAFYFENRLLDGKDPYGIQDVEDIISWLTEEWSGRPTPPPSDSPPSESNGGRNSTQPPSLLI